MISLCVVTLCYVQGTATGQSPDPTNLLLDMKAGETRTQNGVTYTLHQKNAGVADSQGWYLAHSTQGGFSIRFPAKFFDATTVITDKSTGTEFRTNILISGDPAHGDRYFAMCIGSSNSKLYDGADLSSLVDKLRQYSRKLDQHAFAHGEIRGVEYQYVWANGTPIAARMFKVDTQMCTLMVEFRDPPGEGIPDAVRKAFNSFEWRGQKGKP